MTLPEWTATTRKRLGIDVFPAETQCPFCHWGRSDARGNHASMCEGGASRILRHNEVRAVLGKALTDLGYTIGFEHGGGLLDGRKPGDIIAYNWTEGKHMLVDVAVTNPLALFNHPHLLAGGPGRTAKYRESRKRAKYWDLDLTKYHFVPFVIETTGAFGPSASRLCAQMRQIKEMKCCKGADSPNSQTKDTDRTTHDPLRTAISVTVQRHNARMILERQPATTCLIDPAIERCHKDAASVKRWALKQLTKAPRGPLSLLGCGPKTNPAPTLPQPQEAPPAKTPPWTPPEHVAIPTCASIPRQPPLQDGTHKTKWITTTGRRKEGVATETPAPRTSPSPSHQNPLNKLAPIKTKITGHGKGSGTTNTHKSHTTPSTTETPTAPYNAPGTTPAARQVHTQNSKPNTLAPLLEGLPHVTIEPPPKETPPETGTPRNPQPSSPPPTPGESCALRAPT